MGLFSWISKSSSRVNNLPDSIWLTADAKLTGIAAETMSAIETGGLVVVVAHFSETLSKIRQVLSDSAMSHEVIDGAIRPAKLLDRKKRNDGQLILVTLADNLTAEEGTPEPEQNPEQVFFVAGERHPLRTKDDPINAFAKGVPAKCSLRFHSSLQDPILKIFVGESIEKTLRGLGMSETDAITSKLVTNRLKGAQQKLAKAAISDKPAKSPENWIKENCPEIF
jgi:preprotein translocase subunit SecA